MIFGKKIEKRNNASFVINPYVDPNILVSLKFTSSVKQNSGSPSARIFCTGAKKTGKKIGMPNFLVK